MRIVGLIAFAFFAFICTNELVDTLILGTDAGATILQTLAPLAVAAGVVLLAIFGLVRARRRQE